MSKNMLMILENMSIQSKINLLEESSASPEIQALSQRENELTQFFIAETTSMIVREQFLEEAHDMFINRANLILENEEPEQYQDESHPVGTAIGAAATLGSAAWLGSKYRPVKQTIKKAIKTGKQSATAQSYRAIAKDSKRAFNYAKEKSQAGYNAAKEKVQSSYNAVKTKFDK